METIKSYLSQAWHWFLDLFKGKDTASLKRTVAAISAIALTGVCMLSGSLMAWSALALAAGVFIGAIYLAFALGDWLAATFGVNLDVGFFIARNPTVRLLLEGAGFAIGFFLGGGLGGILAGALLSAYTSLGLSVLTSAYAERVSEWNEQKALERTAKKAKEE